MNSITRATLPALLLVSSAACNDTRLATKPEAPVAIIDAEPYASPLDIVWFDGSRSYVEQSEIVSYEWKITKRPGGSTFPLEVEPTDPRFARMQVDIAGDYEISLTVTDARGMDDTDVFHFSSVPWQTIHVALTWDTDETDLDLHFVSVNDGGTFGTPPFDCFYRNPNPDWGVPGVTADDPSLDIDAVAGFGPENINLHEPIDGQAYRVLVRYYDDRGRGATNATVRIYITGQLKFEGIRALDRTGAGWEVATIHWPEGLVEPIDQPFFAAP